MNKSRNPSFSSTLLDEIYNSIDPKTQKSQSFSSSVSTKKQSITVTKSIPDRRIHRDRFFSSVSSSSDSNSSIFSSSDTELTHGKKPSSSSSRPLCFGPSKTKPRKTEDKTLFHQNRANRVYDDYDYTSDVPKITKYDENWDTTRIKRSTKSSNKPKTPASPAGRIVNFINSLFTNNNSKQSNPVKCYPRKTSYDDSIYVKKRNDYYHPSTCSSASSFSRSCLNKTKTSDRIKRSVRFSPVNVIVPEGDFDGYVRKSVKKNVEDGGRRSVEEIAREFLRDYHNKNLKVNKSNDFEDDYEDDDDDDVASDSSSDLFELDLVGKNHHHDRNNNVYGDELPVYETTFAGLIL